MHKASYLVGIARHTITTRLEDILNDRELGTLPSLWHWKEKSLKRFSASKELYSFQQKAIENTIKTLWFYYGQEGEDRQNLKRLYHDNGLGKLVDEFGTNRMGFWMATGSGKTLVIVKLIELLALLGKRKNIPKHDVMFLVYRENLLDQFKMHVNEYNQANPSCRINLIDLQDYEKVKYENAIPFAASINVFYYRADLFLEGKRTAKKINPHSCDNNGNWFVLLDEAHRGDRNDSKLQRIYSRFSRNGFLFNFSATFTDDIDTATCAYNFNLEKFIEDGYGKKICVSAENVAGFREQDEFSDIEKQRIVLKTLILQTYIKQHLDKIRKKDTKLYHNPLLLGIVNSVTDKGSDLRMFFAEIEKIASGKITDGLFEKARTELDQEMGNATYLFGGEPVKIDEKTLSNIQYKDVLKAVFNTASQGEIEAIRVPNNRQELVFKMKTADAPFALIRIGNISNWVKEILANYELTEKYEDESIFSQLNEDNSNINILMGSRTFYEGWDSNRPNIILFVNIGIGKNSRKFVLQAVGRGVRIEPVEGKRKRLQNLRNAGHISKETFTKIKEHVSSLESLFVFGTNADNLKEVISSLRDGKEESFDLGEEFIINPDAKNRLLLIPTYKDSDQPLAEAQGGYPISQNDLDLTKKFFNAVSDKILLVKYEQSPEIIERTKDKVVDMRVHEEDRSINDPSFFAERLMDYFSLQGKEFDRFNELGEKDIIHFRKVRFSGSKENFEQLKQQIERIKNEPKEIEELNKKYGKIPKEEYDEQASLFEKAKEFKDTNIKYLANYYYHPLLISQEDKVAYLKHIISVKSERTFIEVLEKESKSLKENSDWWMFSKLDEALDKVFIPYFSKENKYSNFHPDFIFWLKKKDEYHILFVDPKGTEHTDYQHKADGYAELFCESYNGNQQLKSFSEHGVNIKVHLYFFTQDISRIPKGYQSYWIDNIRETVEKCICPS